MRAELEHARTVNLERAAKLPSFVADEKAVRFKSRHVDPPKWEYADTIESEIAVKGFRFTRQNTRLNGQPWNKPGFPYFTWSARFGQELTALFSPKCPTTIEFEGREEFRGKPVLAYRFHSPPDGCFFFFSTHSSIFSATKRYNPARSGRFLIDDPGGNLLYCEEVASEFPKGFGADPFRQTESWDWVKIGDASYLLPVATEILGGFAPGDLWHVTVEYKNHRHFEASTTLTFEPGEETPPK